jgi:hypothetical protein
MVHLETRIRGICAGSAARDLTFAPVVPRTMDASFLTAPGMKDGSKSTAAKFVRSARTTWKNCVSAAGRTMALLFFRRPSCSANGREQHQGTGQY